MKQSEKVKMTLEPVKRKWFEEIHAKMCSSIGTQTNSLVDSIATDCTIIAMDYLLNPKDFKKPFAVCENSGKPIYEGDEYLLEDDYYIKRPIESDYTPNSPLYKKHLDYYTQLLKTKN